MYIQILLVRTLCQVPMVKIIQQQISNKTIFLKYLVFSNYIHTKSDMKIKMNVQLSKTWIIELSEQSVSIVEK